MEISLFWLYSVWAVSLCDHIEMLYFRAATRWQNTPRHPFQAGLLAPQAGAVQDYEEAAAATAAAFLSSLPAAWCACSGMLLQKSLKDQDLSIFSCP